MKIKSMWKCDLCGKKVEENEYNQVSGSVSIFAGDERNRSYDEACNDCIDKIIKVVDEDFKANRYSL